MSAIKATSCRQFPPLNDNMKSTFQQGQDSLCLDYFSYFNLSPMDAGSVLNVFTIIIALHSRVKYTFPRSQDGVLTPRAERTSSPEWEDGNMAYEPTGDPPAGGDLGVGSQLEGARSRGAARVSHSWRSILNSEPASVHNW